jgi:hypothetical protein
MRLEARDERPSEERTLSGSPLNKKPADLASAGRLTADLSKRC